MLTWTGQRQCVSASVSQCQYQCARGGRDEGQLHWHVAVGASLFDIGYTLGADPTA
jgi:hypothetical protein